jgi:5-methylthioadenosine/S-adenosylhomocysteine deaminase
VIDPATSPALAVRGRIATMDELANGTVIPDGVVYCRDGGIVAVQPATVAPPPGFAAVTVVPTGGTIFPGLIELHNHLPYDVLGLWQVPKRYGNRDQWSSPSTPDYHQLITGPMQVLGSDPRVAAAVVRWVELRCLLGGTTTSQGVTLATDPGLIQHFRGLVRNVESTGDPTLPAAATHIADVEADDRAKFLARISGTTKMILHLAEGTDSAAHDHFAALQGADGQWAITSNLVGIHCVALTEDDFGILAGHGGSMVWSPFSNLLLYGQTANVGAAIAQKVPIALGSDWSPSGSKNLLGELKVARLAAPGAGATLSDEALVAMATLTPARLLGWDHRLGSIEAGKLADLIVVTDTSAAPHTSLVDATEAAIALVIINGIPRAGTPQLMTATGASTTEMVTIGGQPRALNLAQPTSDPAVAAISAAQAQALLTAALQDLPNHHAGTGTSLPAGQIRLAVEGLVDNQMSPRHHLPLNGRPTGPNRATSALSTTAPVGPLPALTLDPLTAIDNATFYETIAAEMNLPLAIRSGLAAYASLRKTQ